VEEFHPDTSGCDFSLASRVPLVIHFCKGLHTAGTIDQSQRAGQWNRLVRLPFYINHTAAIEIGHLNSDLAGVWAADAFRLTWDAANCHDEEVEADEAVAPTDEAEPYEGEAEAYDLAKDEKALPLLQAIVDDVDSKALGSTLEPISQCPATTAKTFHHDAMKKDQLAQVTFHFDPPSDGCYLIEELHPQVGCKASPNTKVHVKYCKGLEAFGEVDQTANAGQWTFLGAFPFYAGHPGNVTLSNEGTKPRTLAIFDQVRFTWSGASCSRVQAHPRQVEIRMIVDLKYVSHSPSKFGSALTAKFAKLANVPERSLRLIIVEFLVLQSMVVVKFLVLPSVVDDPLFMGSLNALQATEKLRIAVDHNGADLCALTGAPLEGCKVEFTDLGVAMPSVRPTPKQGSEQQDEEEEETLESDKGFNPVAVAAFISAFVVLKLALYCYVVRSSKKKQESYATVIPNKAAESDVTASMEEGKALEEKNLDLDEQALKVEENDNASTLAPSSEKQSEPSLNGDDETKSEASLVILKALSEGNI
jgi:hypothetical protein